MKKWEEILSRKTENKHRCGIIKKRLHVTVEKYDTKIVEKDMERNQWKMIKED